MDIWRLTTCGHGLHCSSDYNALSMIRARLNTLESRREQLTERFFKRSVLRETSCLHYLLTDKRDSSITDRPSHAKTFKLLPTIELLNFANLSYPHCLCHYDSAKHSSIIIFMIICTHCRNCCICPIICVWSNSFQSPRYGLI